MACISNNHILCSNTLLVFINWLMLTFSSFGSMLSPCFICLSEHWGPIFNQDISCSLSQYPWKVPEVSFSVQRQSALDTVAWLVADWPRSLKCFGVLRHQESDPAERDLVAFLVGNHAEMSLTSECQKWCKHKGGPALPAGRRELACHLKGRHGTAVQVATVWFSTPRWDMYWWYELRGVCWETCLSAWGISFKRFDV